MIKQKNYENLLNDEAQYSFKSHEELEEYLSFRNENDILISCSINELSAYGLENLPLFIEEQAKNIMASRDGFKIPCEPLDLDNIKVQECINDIGLFLIVPYENKYEPMPISVSAYASILGRADDYSNLMARLEPKSAKKVLPITEKAVRITRDFELNSESCLILIRDGKVRAAHSRVFCWLDNEILINELEKYLETEHSDYTWISGIVNENFLISEYNLNNTLMEESLRFQLNENGADVHELSTSIQFITSDTGDSAVWVNLVYKIDSTRVVIKGINIEHKGEASEEKFIESLKSFAKVLEESEAKIEELGNTDIKNVPETYKKIIMRFSSVFPEKVSKEVYDELRINFPNGGTAMDVFLALNDTITRHLKSSNASVERALLMTDQIAKMINLPFDKIDNELVDWD